MHYRMLHLCYCRMLMERQNSWRLVTALLLWYAELSPGLCWYLNMLQIKFMARSMHIDLKTRNLAQQNTTAQKPVCRDMLCFGDGNCNWFFPVQVRESVNSHKYWHNLNWAIWQQQPSPWENEAHSCSWFEGLGVFIIRPSCYGMTGNKSISVSYIFLLCVAFVWRKRFPSEDSELVDYHYSWLKKQRQLFLVSFIAW